jgi:hypothetical protein
MWARSPFRSDLSVGLSRVKLQWDRDVPTKSVDFGDVKKDAVYLYTGGVSSVRILSGRACI